MWGLQAELMHDPPSFDAIWSSVPVEHQRFPHPYNLLRGRIHHRSILSCCFPIPRSGCSVCSKPRRVFAVPEAEEVPLVRIQLRHLCDHSYQHMHMTHQFLVSTTRQHMTKLRLN